MTTIRTLGLALFLGAMTFACTQKMAPVDEPADGDKTTQDATTMPADDAKKDAPANSDTAKDTAPAPAADTKTDAPVPAKTDDTKKDTTPAPAKTDDAKKDTTPDPFETPECLAQCKDPDCFSKCFGSGGDNPFGF